MHQKNKNQPFHQGMASKYLQKYCGKVKGLEITFS